MNRTFVILTFAALPLAALTGLRAETIRPPDSTAAADPKLLKATDNALVVQKGASATDGFSKYLSPYQAHPSALTKTVTEIFQATLSEQSPLHPVVAAKRRQVIQMYLDFGIDISVGKEACATLPAQVVVAEDTENAVRKLWSVLFGRRLLLSPDCSRLRAGRPAGQLHPCGEHQTAGRGR